MDIRKVLPLVYGTQTSDPVGRRATVESASTIGVAGGIDRNEASPGSMLWIGSTPGIASTQNLNQPLAHLISPAILHDFSPNFLHQL
jgi:hypothetical protein